MGATGGCTNTGCLTVEEEKAYNAFRKEVWGFAEANGYRSGNMVEAVVPLTLEERKILDGKVGNHLLGGLISEGRWEDYDYMQSIEPYGYIRLKRRFWGK